jgi:hypothetical protein
VLVVTRESGGVRPEMIFLPNCRSFMHKTATERWHAAHSQSHSRCSIMKAFDTSHLTLEISGQLGDSSTCLGAEDAVIGGETPAEACASGKQNVTKSDRFTDVA